MVPVGTVISVPSRAGVTGEGGVLARLLEQVRHRTVLRGYVVAAREGSPFQAEEWQAGRNVYPWQVLTVSFCWGQEKPQPPGLPPSPVPLYGCPYIAALHSRTGTEPLLLYTLRTPAKPRMGLSSQPESAVGLGSLL